MGILMTVLFSVLTLFLIIFAIMLIAEITLYILSKIVKDSDLSKKLLKISKAFNVKKFEVLESIQSLINIFRK